jgi:GNAT superfamily N-acetyltransferase
VPTADVRDALAVAYTELYAALREADPAAARIETLGGTRCTRTSGIDEPGWSFYLNQANGLGRLAPATEQAVDDVLDFYGPARPPFIVTLEPDARPRAVAGWLEARTLRRRLLLARSQRTPDATAAVAERFRVEDIGPDRADTYAALAGHGLPAAVVRAVASLIGRPGWTHSVATSDAGPVAAGVLFVHQGIGCLSWSSTHPAQRRQGAHAALIAHRLRRAAEIGCAQVVAETLEVSATRPGAALRNLTRAGFEPTLNARVYVS